MVSLEEKWKDKKIYDSAFYGVKVKIASWSFVCECVCFCLCVSVCVLGSKEKSISCLIMVQNIPETHSRETATNGIS